MIVADEWIRITHPEVGVSPHPVTRQAYNSTWQGLGWTEVAPVVADAADLVGAPVSSLSELTKEQLLELANTKSLVVAGNATKADLISAIEQAPTGGEG